MATPLNVPTQSCLRLSSNSISILSSGSPLSVTSRTVTPGCTAASEPGAPNVPALLESHYAIPALGAVLNALNYRLDARGIAFCLEHGKAKALIVDSEFAVAVGQALRMLGRELIVIDIDDDLAGPADSRVRSRPRESRRLKGFWR